MYMNDSIINVHQRILKIFLPGSTGANTTFFSMHTIEIGWDWYIVGYASHLQRTLEENCQQLLSGLPPEVWWGQPESTLLGIICHPRDGKRWNKDEKGMESATICVFWVIYRTLYRYRTKSQQDPVALHQDPLPGSVCDPQVAEKSKVSDRLAKWSKKPIFRRWCVGHMRPLWKGISMGPLWPKSPKLKSTNWLQYMDESAHSSGGWRTQPASPQIEKNGTVMQFANHQPNHRFISPCLGWLMLASIPTSSLWIIYHIYPILSWLPSPTLFANRSPQKMILHISLLRKSAGWSSKTIDSLPQKKVGWCLIYSNLIPPAQFWWNQLLNLPKNLKIPTSSPRAPRGSTCNSSWLAPWCPWRKPPLFDEK